MVLSRCRGGIALVCNAIDRLLSHISDASGNLTLAVFQDYFFWSTETHDTLDHRILDLNWFTLWLLSLSCFASSSISIHVERNYVPISMITFSIRNNVWLGGVMPANTPCPSPPVHIKSLTQHHLDIRQANRATAHLLLGTRLQYKAAARLRRLHTPPPPPSWWSLTPQWSNHVGHTFTDSHLDIIQDALPYLPLRTSSSPHSGYAAIAQWSSLAGHTWIDSNLDFWP